MATKKEKDAAYEQFLADLKAINPQFEELLKDEKASTKLREGVLARQDYSSSMDALRKEREDMEGFLTQERQKIEGWTNWYRDVTSDVTKMQQELTAYRDEYGELTREGKHAARQQGISQEEFKKVLEGEFQQREVATMKFLDDLTELKIEHRERFKERLNTADVFKVAAEKNLPLDLAYQVYTADKVEAERKNRYDEDMKKAREEGAAEALAKHNLPMVPSTSDIRPHSIDSQDAPKDSRARVSAAVAAFVGGNKS
jgi:hypothetical protein